MNSAHEPAQIPHNLHYSSAKFLCAPQPVRDHAAVVKGIRLVGAVGIEFIRSQNLCCSRKFIAVLGRNYCCPRIAPAFL
jgi:hypothetical protein